ncbi:hypothetical protein BJ508DRAFT_230411 [Ascobolus immersus RN42]|uniref:LysM domain-containing protein n=1 Tax=Ascobolus immersus RN42 TaxID=1160509 RepID=A0A3N4HMS6_ASCIM|nr:hypothetical protein BJ508DRAFT_230411 [Ascobolus immersus RN42]
MKYTAWTALAGILFSLDTALSTAIPHPSQPSSSLSRRAFSIGQWLANRAYYRSTSGWGSGECLGTHVVRPKVIDWPLRSGQVIVCLVANQMAEGVSSECNHEQNVRNRPQDYNLHMCPETFDEFVDKVVTFGRADNPWGTNGDWQVPIGRDEAIRGVAIYLPEEAVPQEYRKYRPQTVPQQGVPNRDHMAPPVVGVNIPAPGVPDRGHMTPPPANIPQQGVPDRNHMAPSAPAPTQADIAGGCSNWHVAKEGDSCYWIAENNGVGLGQFYDWNPKVNDGGECRGLWIGYAYCIRA